MYKASHKVWGHLVMIVEAPHASLLKTPWAVDFMKSKDKSDVGQVLSLSKALKRPPTTTYVPMSNVVKPVLRLMP